MPEYLRTTVVIDYQSVHLVGHSVFDKHLPQHETLVDPASYAGQLVFERNRRQRDGYAPRRSGQGPRLSRGAVR